MRRLGNVRLDSIQLDVYDCLGDFLMRRHETCQLAALLQHDLIQLVILMLQMRQTRFQCLDLCA